MKRRDTKRRDGSRRAGQNGAKYGWIAFGALLRNEFVLMFSSWRTVLLLLLLPVMMLLTMVAAFAPLSGESAFVEPFSIALVDQEQSVWTAMLIRQLEPVSLVGDVLETTEAEAIRLIREGEVAAAIVIPSNLSGTISMFEPATATIYGSSQFSLQSNVIRNIGLVGADIVSTGMASMETIRILTLEGGSPPEELFSVLDEAFEAFFFRVLARRDVFAAPPAKSMALSLVEYYGAGLIAVFLLFASLPCMKRLATDRHNGVRRRLFTTPVPPWMPIAAQWLVSLAVSALQFSVIVLVLTIGFDAWWGVPPLWTLLLFLGTVMASSGFSLLVATVSDSPVTVDLVGNLSVLVMAVAGGSLYAPAVMPYWVRPLSALTVVRWSREGFLGVFSGDVSEIGRNTLMLFVLAAGYLFLAVLLNRFRKGRAS